MNVVRFKNYEKFSVWCRGGGANRPKCSRTWQRVWPVAVESAELAEAWAAARRSRSRVAGSISMTEECTAAVGRTEKHTDTASAPVSKARENTPVPGTTVLKFPVFTPGQGKKKISSSFHLFGRLSSPGLHKWIISNHFINTPVAFSAPISKSVESPDPFFPP